MINLNSINSQDQMDFDGVKVSIAFLASNRLQKQLALQTFFQKVLHLLRNNLVF